MLYVINFFTIFLMFKSISGGPPLYPNIGFAQYQRSLPETEVNQNKNVELLLPANKVHSGENMQQLLPVSSSLEADGNVGFEVPNKTPSKKVPKRIVDRNAAPDNVHRVQEMTALLWPMGVIPYFIDKKSYDTTTKKRIIKGMAAIEAVSCVTFRELAKKPDGDAGSWLHFTNPKQEKECRHMFEVVNGGSEVVLGFECLRPEEILHSLLHALGFRDEVTHPQRGHYIRVMWDNIQPKYRDLFRIQYEDAAYKLVEYDPMSIMHFHDRAFSENGAATIVALIPGLQITPTTTLSQLDIMRLKLAFSHECNKRNVGDLLDTCKNSLWNKKRSEMPDEIDKEDSTNEESGKLDNNEGGSAEQNEKLDEKPESDGDKSESNDSKSEHNTEERNENEEDGLGEEGKMENKNSGSGVEVQQLKKYRGFRPQSVNGQSFLGQYNAGSG